MYTCSTATLLLKLKNGNVFVKYLNALIDAVLGVISCGDTALLLYFNETPFGSESDAMFKNIYHVFSRWKAIKTVSRTKLHGAHFQSKAEWCLSATAFLNAKF